MRFYAAGREHKNMFKIGDSHKSVLQTAFL